ncbi:MAG: hypothetical protein EA356_15385 [Geminicoccaceae bacterium]|nr:MAG: hypothetical protein EA356_15385 [Geminicoccaceae bacterium]
MHRSSFWSGLVVVGFALLALYWIIPTYAGRAIMRGMPPDLLPRVAAWIMLLSGLCVVATSAFRMVQNGERLIAADIDWRAFGWAAWPFLYVGGCVYLLTLTKVTYLGVPMIALMLVLLGERRWYVVIPCSIAPVGLLYLLSVHLMRVGVV